MSTASPKERLWCFRLWGDGKPGMIDKHLPRMVKTLAASEHDAVKRNIVRLLQNIDIPKDLQGEAANACFKFLGSAEEAIAIRAFSMTVLFNIGKEEPDLLPELRMMIEDMMPYGSSGIKARGRRTLAAIDKILAKHSN